MAAGVAHEINNPNGVVSLNLHVLQRELDRFFAALQPGTGAASGGGTGAVDPGQSAREWRDIIGEALRASERIAGIVASLKSFARPANETEKERFALPEVIEEAGRWLRHDYKVAQCRLECAFEPNLPHVWANRQQVLQVFVNLMQNACQAVTGPDQVVKVSGSYAREEGAVKIAVADEGRGMPAEVIEHALDPFFTTRRSEGGLGLGLSISAAILRAHGGRLRIEPREDAGTIATVTLPVREEAAHGE
jgi:polar amino acid transport system substrate-binding protein